LVVFSTRAKFHYFGLNYQKGILSSISQHHQWIIPCPALTIFIEIASLQWLRWREDGSFKAGAARSSFSLLRELIKETRTGWMLRKEWKARTFLRVKLIAPQFWVMTWSLIRLLSEACEQKTVCHCSQLDCDDAYDEFAQSWWYSCFTMQNNSIGETQFPTNIKLY